jgi:hypothetical protein
VRRGCRLQGGIDAGTPNCFRPVSRPLRTCRRGPRPAARDVRGGQTRPSLAGGRGPRSALRRHPLGRGGPPTRLIARRIRLRGALRPRDHLADVLVVLAAARVRGVVLTANVQHLDAWVRLMRRAGLDVTVRTA